MNSLSWLIYWADVLPSMANLICVISFIATIALLGMCLVRFFCAPSVIKIAKYEEARASYEALEQKQGVRNPYPDDFNVTRGDWDNVGFRKATTWAPYLVPLPLLLWAVSFLVPQKDTFYMIAASEAGESVLNSPEITKVRTIINNYLDKTIKEQQPAKET